jgi:hypothetical protein
VNKRELANLIKSFLNGTCGNWDWDDFTSVKQRDVAVEKIRQEILDFPDIYPAQVPTEWCNEEGRKALLAIAEAISSEKQ